jgi:hypothetical protein
VPQLKLLMLLLLLLLKVAVCTHCTPVDRVVALICLKLVCLAVQGELGIRDAVSYPPNSGSKAASAAAGEL